MSFYDTNDFVYSFAKRTLMNLEFIEQNVESQKARGVPIPEIKIFEVTQLVNSFLGLLILPKEAHFLFIEGSDSFPDGSQSQEVFEMLVKQRMFTLAVTNSVTGELVHIKLTPKLLVLKLRNSVAHNRFDVRPEKHDDTGEIEGFVFKDAGTNTGYIDEEHGFIFCKDGTQFRMSFRLEINIEQLKILLMGLCNLLLSQYPKTINELT